MATKRKTTKKRATKKKALKVKDTNFRVEFSKNLKNLEKKYFKK